MNIDRDQERLNEEVREACTKDKAALSAMMAELAAARSTADSATVQSVSEQIVERWLEMLRHGLAQKDSVIIDDRGLPVCALARARFDLRAMGQPLGLDGPATAELVAEFVEKLQAHRMRVPYRIVLNYKDRTLQAWYGE